MALTTNLLAYYKLDGNSNDSVGSNNGTDTSISYSPSYGKINQGANFNGTSSNFYVADNVSLSITGELSIGLWIKFTTTAAGVIIEKDDESGYNRRGYNVTVYAGNISFSVGNNSGYPTVTTASTYNDGNWHYVVCVYNPTGTSMKIYVDNILDGNSSSGPSAIYDNGNPFNVGRRNNGFGPDRYYTGSLDEIGIWSRALSGSEISQLYNSGAGLQYPFTTFNPAIARRRLLVK